MRIIATREGFAGAVISKGEVRLGTVGDKFIHTPSFFLYFLHNLKTIIAMGLEFSPNGRHVVVEIRGKFQTKILFSRVLTTESPKKRPDKIIHTVGKWEHNYRINSQWHDLSS